MPTASRPCCAVLPIATAAFEVTKPCTTHWPPLEGTKTATMELPIAVKSGKVSGVERLAKKPANCAPTVVYCSSPATPPYR